MKALLALAKKKTSVLIPAVYPGEVTPDDAVSALAFFVLKITLFSKDAAGNKAVAEQRNAYFVSADALQDAAEQARGLGWSVELDVIEMGVAAHRPAERTKGTWLRFMYRLADGPERGALGRILAGVLFDHCIAGYLEPWPENDVALYVKDEADNAALVMRLSKAANLTPIGMIKTEGL